MVVARDVERVYRFGSQVIRAIHDVNLEVGHGEFLAIMGRSGSGKTTLLNLLAGLDRPTQGRVFLAGQDLAFLSDKELSLLRAKRVGFVFQSFGLFPLLSTYENVELPLRIAGVARGERDRLVRAACEVVDLLHRLRHRPYELSGGEQQRVAIARAIVHRPALVLADEPTAELDSRTALAIFTLLRDVVARDKVTLIVATHDEAIAGLASRVERLQDGTLASSRTT